MSNVITFIVERMLTKTFWCMFLACFTMVLMVSWRGQLRDEIFKEAVGKFRWK